MSDADHETGADTRVLRRVAVIAGIASAILFVAVGVGYRLQMYGDGSLFSYAVAVEDVWAFHWHNISDRVSVYLFSLLPAEVYVGLTEDARGGIAIYGLLFYVAQALGLLAAFHADRSRGRIIFTYACCSTALLCPLVFGAPTEMWIAHALFWPALAVSLYAPIGLRGTLLVFAVLLALCLTHEGALILAGTVLLVVALRGRFDAVLARTAGALLVALSIWAAVKLVFPPDDYFEGVLVRAALNFFNGGLLTGDLIVLVFAALAAYAMVFLLLRMTIPGKAHFCAAAVVAVALATYWLRFDHALHTQNRYYMRTVLLVGTTGLGGLAGLYAIAAEGLLPRRIPLLPRLMQALATGAAVRAATGAMLVLMLIHIVETAKFVTAWTQYEAGIRALATGTASDPILGDRLFVSSARLDAGLQRLSWSSTTLYLSVLVAPNLVPQRLVIDPTGNYFWLSCDSATKNLAADRVVPAESRRLLQVYACLHR